MCRSFACSALSSNIAMIFAMCIPNSAKQTRTHTLLFVYETTISDDIRLHAYNSHDFPTRSSFHVNLCCNIQTVSRIAALPLRVTSSIFKHETRSSFDLTCCNISRESFIIETRHSCTPHDCKKKKK